MKDREILDCIGAIVGEEHRLREQREQGLLSETVEVRRLEQLEASLDQLWDLLRRRRALRSAGLDPEDQVPVPAPWA